MSDHGQNQQDQRSPDEIESDINQTRSHLDDTLSDLQQRFSPEYLMNTTLEYVRGSGSNEFFSNLGSTVRNNPMPVALMGLGIGWLMVSSNSQTGGTFSRGDTSSHGGIRSHFSDRRQKKARKAAARTAPYGDSPLDDDSRDLDEELYQPEAEYNDDDAYTMTNDNSSHRNSGQRSQRARHKAQQFSQGSRDRMRNMKSGTGSAMHRASDSTRQAGTSASDFIHDNPVAAGAIGIALGAVMGSLLPSSRTEQRAMGDTRDHLVDRATEAGQEQVSRAKDKAQEKQSKHQDTSSPDSHNPERTASTTGTDTGQTSDTNGSSTSDTKAYPGASERSDRVGPDEPLRSRDNADSNKGSGRP